jgi:regulator of nonsense transcripts 2
LKRNTAFIKRLRTSINSPESTQVLLKEISSLSLEKYVSEIVGAAVEGIARCKTATEIFGAIEVGALFLFCVAFLWNDQSKSTTRS